MGEQISLKDAIFNRMLGCIGLVRICSGCGSPVEGDEFIEVIMYSPIAVVTTVYHDIKCLKKGIKEMEKEEVVYK